MPDFPGIGMQELHLFIQKASNPKASRWISNWTQHLLFGQKAIGAATNTLGATVCGMRGWVSHYRHIAAFGRKGRLQDLFHRRYAAIKPRRGGRVWGTG